MSGKKSAISQEATEELVAVVSKLEEIWVGGHHNIVSREISQEIHVRLERFWEGPACML